MTNDKSAELLPCPFCGGEVRLIQYIGITGIVHFNAECRTNECTAFHRADISKQVVVERWNTRHDLKGKIVLTEERLQELFDMAQTFDPDCDYVTHFYSIDGLLAKAKGGA